MNHILVNTLAVAVVLGVIVFVHELGHFLAAKAFGVRVETFSLGFGKRLFGLTVGGTDYRISLLPVGGYVKMAGENPMDQPSGRSDEFLSKPRWQRFIIAFAGPFMNAVLAVGLLIPVYMREYPHNPVLDQPAVVAEVQPGSPAAQAGIQPQDRIVEIDGVAQPDWETVFLKTAVSVDHAIGVTVERNGALIHTQLTPKSDGADNPPLVGVAPEQSTRFGAITAASPAARAGLRDGDLALRVNGAPVLDPGNLIEQIQAVQPSPAGPPLGTAGHAVRLDLERGGQALSLQVTPVLQENLGRRQWMIGAAFVSDTTFLKLPFSEALKHSLADNKQYSMVILDLVGKLVSHHASIQNLQGPVGIASVTGDAARASSLLPLFSVTSLISLNLGILNLLPIPVLDGGMILFLFIESILRHEISLRIKERVYQAGFAFLLILMTVVVYNDIVRAVVIKN
ncbi:MAG TPA: RIP metalloprotease RseP [Terriglobales bacterium]|nr:RIP metalloprotease RseP [Terriglobales bacterium]